MKVPGQVYTEGTHNLKKIYPSYKNFCEANISGFSHAINGKIFIQVSNVFIAGRSVAFTKANFRISIRTHIRTRAFNSINVLFGAENHGIQLDWVLKSRKKNMDLGEEELPVFRPFTRDELSTIENRIFENKLAAKKKAERRDRNIAVRNFNSEK